SSLSHYPALLKPRRSEGADEGENEKNDRERDGEIVQGRFQPAALVIHGIVTTKHARDAFAFDLEQENCNQRNGHDDLDNIDDCKHFYFPWLSGESKNIPSRGGVRQHYIIGCIASKIAKASPCHCFAKTARNDNYRRTPTYSSTLL